MDILTQRQKISTLFYRRILSGATIIVTKAGKTLFRKAYGLADVERRIALKPESVMRLGSLTKQFTAVAIMRLVDESGLAVSDDITKFLPDYPTHGQRITLEHLLHHTSGIKNYTDMPTFKNLIDRKMTVQQMIDFFKHEPLDFKPGSQFSYSNSGYFLLGATIEHVSGMTYASFMAKHLFEPLGMTDTAYEGYERSGAKRVEGYSGKKKAAFMSMTQPYAAGALVSTVEDLAIWDAAISAGELLTSNSWQQVFTPHNLKRRPWNPPYGYGWIVTQFKGNKTFEHGGGIFGFATYPIRIPQDKVYVAVLMNNDGGDLSWFNLLYSLLNKKNPKSLAEKAAAIAINK